MNYTDFSQFYDLVIGVDIDDLFHKYSNYADNRKLRVPAVQLRRNAKRSIFRHYQKKRDAIKKYFMKNPDGSLDAHKVASCLIYAILKSKPIKINKFIPDLPQEILLANEYIAVCVAFNVVDMYRREKGDENFRLVVPSTYHDIDERSEFVPNLCKALYYNKRLSYFDIFAYADILFLLEKYTDVTK